MEFQYRAGDARSPSTAAAATSVNSESVATRVQDDYGGDGSGYHGENSEAVAPLPASDPDDLRRQAAKDRIRERILREEAETLALEAEVRRELMEELRSQLARSARAGACAKGPEARAAPAADSPSLKTPIGHQVGSEAGVSAALQANKRKTRHVAAASNVSAATSNKKQKPDLTCTVCSITATSEGALQEHLKGKSHGRKAAKLARPLLAGAGHHEVVSSKVNGSEVWPAKGKDPTVDVASTVFAASNSNEQKPNLTCTVCGITSTSQKAMQDHLDGKLHRRKALTLSQTVPKEDMVSSKVNGSVACPAKGKDPTVAVTSMVFAASNSNEQKPDLTCTMCGITSTSQKAMQDHLKGKLHRKKALTLSQTVPKEDMVCSEPNASAAALLPAKRKNSHAVPAASTISAAASSEKEKQDLTCTVCGITAISEKVMQDHLKGEAHARKAAAFTQPPPPPEDVSERNRQEETEEMNGFLLCEVCDVKAADVVTMVCHLQGSKHISKANKQQEEQPKAAAVASGGDPELDTVAVEANGVCRADDGFLLCELCDVKAPSQVVMQSHLSGKKHTNKQKAAVVDAGKAVLARDKTDKDVAVVTSGNITVTPGRQAKKADAAATVGDSVNKVVLDGGVVENVDGFLHRQNVSMKDKEKAKVCVVDVGAGGKRAILEEAKSKEAASVVDDSTGHGNDESMEEPAVENMEVVPSATPREDGATPVCGGSSVAPMEVDDHAHAEAGDGAAKSEEEKQEGKEVKMQVEGKLFMVLRQADGSLSCGLCGHHGCDKDRMVDHLYTREHWRRARLSEHKDEQAKKGSARRR
uniref:Uncharacterized protein n=1 Tax=Avena sativa TaxID=4498 RepID=A0ACD5Y5N3_AVESA